MRFSVSPGGSPRQYSMLLLLSMNLWEVLDSWRGIVYCDGMLGNLGRAEDSALGNLRRACLL